MDVFIFTGVSNLNQVGWVPLSEQAVNVICKLAEHPDTICREMIRKVCCSETCKFFLLGLYFIIAAQIAQVAQPVLKPLVMKFRRGLLSRSEPHPILFFNK